MNNLFIDTNVLLDVLDHRQPFYEDSAAVWSLAEKGKIRCCISAISFNNIYYILRKQQSPAVIRKTLCLLRDIFDIVTLDERILNQAMDSNFKDFEDAIQYFSASRVSAQCILSRNLNHYKASEIPILTPAEFLASHTE
jgi:predicted nucleic acid-binding protein